MLSGKPPLSSALLHCKSCHQLEDELAATLGWFTAGDAVRIPLRQLSQTWKLRHYDVIDDVIIWVQDGNCKKWLKRILVLVRSTI